MADYRVEPVANYHCACGENPLWDDRRQVALWCDIPTGRLFRYDPAAGTHECFYQAGDPNRPYGRLGSPDCVGGFTLQDDGRLLLFGAGRVWMIDDAGNEQDVCRLDDPGIPRFNDVIADPAGRVLAGTMGKAKDSGGLFRLDRDGTLTCLFRGTGCSNGLGFTPDRAQVYWTDSTARRIWVFDYDAARGELANRRLFHACPPEEKTPDGLTVDAEGNIWTARWDGFCIRVMSPQGQQIEKIDFPVGKVSSCIFGGGDWSDLYVTTAGGSPDSPAADGTLYRVRTSARGLPEFRSKVML